MPINIVCKECKHKQRLLDIPWILKGNYKKEENKLTCPKCGRVLINYER